MPHLAGDPLKPSTSEVPPPEDRKRTGHSVLARVEQLEEAVTKVSVQEAGIVKSTDILTNVSATLVDRVSKLETILHEYGYLSKE